jgi:photosystem II stability/assembly factor-like uncharacterized protein
VFGLLVVVSAVLSGCASSSLPTRVGGPPGSSVIGQPAPSGSGTLEAVSCGSPSDCVAVGQAAAGAHTTVESTDDAGLRWRAVDVSVPDPTDLGAIDCANVADCMAVGSSDQDGPISAAVLVTSDGGVRWTAVAGPADAANLSAVDCASATACIVIATDGTNYWSATTDDFGQVWQRGGTLPANVGGISSIACPSAGRCVTVGYGLTAPGQGQGAIDATDDAGATWTPQTVPPGIGLLHGVACPGSTRCIATGTTSTTTTDVAQAAGALVSTTDGGATWDAETAPPGVDDAWSVSCPAVRSCAVVGTVWTPTTPPTPIGGVVTTDDGGTTWHVPTIRYVPVGLTGVDCPTARHCVATGNDVLARLTLPAAAAPGPSRTQTQTVP